MSVCCMWAFGPFRFEKMRGVVCAATGKTLYGYPDNEGLELARITTKGLPRRTGDTIAVDFSDIHEVVWWRGTVMGIAEHTFPHPQEWRLRGADAPLESMNVKRGIKNTPNTGAKKEKNIHATCIIPRYRTKGLSRMTTLWNRWMLTYYMKSRISKKS